MKKIFLLLLVSTFVSSAVALPINWLGFQAGNDDEANFESFLTNNSLVPSDVSSLGKVENGADTLGPDFTFTPGLADLFDEVTSGSISYSGVLTNIVYVTVKVGNAGPAQNDRTQGFHVYSWIDGGFDFDLLTDPNPDFVKQGNTVSHVSVWTGGVPVPDSGATLALLGFGLAALGIIRRRAR